jgi:hypothetical protein
MSIAVEFFVLVDAGDNDVHKIREELLKVTSITAVHCLLGPHDLLCLCRVDAFDQVQGVLRDQIAPLIEAKFNPINHTESFLVLERCNQEDFSAIPEQPAGMGVWVFCDLNTGDTSVIQAFLRKNQAVKSVFNITGQHDAVVYVEAPSQTELMEAIDVGIRSLRTLSAGGSRKALARTDTRLVLM